MLPRHMPVLETRRLRLREWTDRDVNAVVEAGWDPLIPLITTVPAQGTSDQAREFITRQQDRLASAHGYAFAIAQKRSNEAVGHFYVHLANLHHGRLTLGYWLTASSRGHGYAAEALAAVTAWALEADEVSRVDLFIEPSNIASCRTAEKCGFEREGLLRRWQCVGETPRDMFSYSKIR